MANNIEINYYNGSAYTVLYPKINLNNNDGNVLSTSYIPSLSASKITSGTFSSARIPSLDMSKITTGNLDASRVTGLSSPTYIYGSYNGTNVSGTTNIDITLKSSDVMMISVSPSTAGGPYGICLFSSGMICFETSGNTVWGINCLLNLSGNVWRRRGSSSSTTAYQLFNQSGKSYDYEYIYF